MTVYKICNTINDKVYIGATKRSLADRWKEHCSCGEKGENSTHELYRDMYNYGLDKFNIEVLKECVSYEELYDTETYYIQKYGAVEHGYNTYHCSPTREDWEEFYQHMKDSMTDEVKGRISQSLKSYRQKHPFSDKHKQRLSERAKGNTNGEGNPSHSIGCYCIIDGMRRDFNNYKEAGVWWYMKDKPFGDKYSQATYQRKIIDCIETGGCKFQRKDKSYVYITKDDIEWYRK